MHPPAHAAYSERLAARRASAQQLEARHEQLANVRLLLAGVAAFMAFAAFYWEWFSAAWLWLPAAAFVVLAIYHNSVAAQRDLALRTVNFFARGLARIEDRWQGSGQSATRFADPHHVYAADLDLFGTGSLFELLSLARTRMGEDELARWLCAPSALEEIHVRHACIVDLRERIDLREHLALLGDESVTTVQPEALIEWAEAPNQLHTAVIRWSARLVPLSFVAAVVLWMVTGIAAPLLASVLAAVAVLRGFRKPLQHTLGSTENAFEGLKTLTAVLRKLESEPFTTPEMATLLERLRAKQQSAAKIMGQLTTVVQLVESRRNLFMQVLELPLLYSLQVALAAERWRSRYGHLVRAWLEATGRIEALISLAAYSYEHPADPFPEFHAGAACFEGTALGHPLLPADKCVRNTVGIGAGSRIALVSGSNMSGKSTLLRTVGINVVLAMAGAPVRAAALRLTPLQVGASIRINDSLLEGSSRFYAEITRLRQLYDLTLQPLRVLVLLDEVLQGTNSRDRRIGVEGMVRAFIDKGAIGLISTHDLALTDIQGVAEGQVVNMHFQDELREGRMSFDFTLRPGVVTKSNGVELMRSIGLQV
jgi:hypothetical protein